MDYSMLGSGIYSTETTLSYICELEILDDKDNLIRVCDFDGEVLAHIDDFGDISATCPKCSQDTALGSTHDW